MDFSRALSLSLSPTTFPTVLILHRRIRPLSLTFIHSLCNVQHHQHPLSILHAPFPQIPLFVLHLPLHQSINAENLHAVVTSLSAGRKKETKTMSNVQKTHSSSSDGNVVKIASKLKIVQRQRTDRQRSRDRLIFRRLSVNSGRVCRERNVSSGSRWRRIRRRSMSSYTPTMFIVRSEPRTRMARRKTRRPRNSTKTQVAFLSSSQSIAMVDLHLHPLRLLISPSKFRTSTT